MSLCDTDLARCIDACPCQALCPDGCSNCNTGFCECHTNGTSQEQVICEDEASIELGHCVNDCKSDQQCISECLRLYDIQTQKCPCNSKCLNGCPCPEYECPIATTAVSTTMTTTNTGKNQTAVLILNTHSGLNAPVLTNLDGRGDALHFFFKVEKNVNVYVSCSLTFEGEFWIFGGYRDDQRQIAKVSDCTLSRVGTLPFTLYGGSCTVADNQLFLCFGDSRSCNKTVDPMGDFTGLQPSIYSHRFIRMASSERKCV